MLLEQFLGDFRSLMPEDTWRRKSGRRNSDVPTFFFGVDFGRHGHEPVLVQLMFRPVARPQHGFLRVAKFFQVEHRLDLLVDLKLASELPSLLVQGPPPRQ